MNRNLIIEVLFPCRTRIFLQNLENHFPALTTRIKFLALDNPSKSRI